MSILDQNLNESLLNEYQANRRKTLIILFCFVATFVLLSIYNYINFKLPLGTILGQSFLSAIFCSFIPGMIAMATHFRLHWNWRDTFLKGFTIQSVLIVSTILIFSLKNDNLSAIYLITVVFVAIILTVFYLAKSGWQLAPFGLLGIFVMGIYNFTSKLFLRPKD